MLVSRPDITIPKPLIPTANTARSEASDKKQQAHSDGSNAIFGLSATIVILALILGLFSLLEALPVAHAADSKAVDTSLKSALGLDLKKEVLPLRSYDRFGSDRERLAYLLDEIGGKDDPVIQHISLPKFKGSGNMTDCELWTKANSVFRPGDPEGDVMTALYSTTIQSPLISSLNLTGCVWPLAFTAPGNRDTATLGLTTFANLGGTGSSLLFGPGFDAEHGAATASDLGKAAARFPLETIYFYEANISPQSQKDIWAELPLTISFLGTELSPTLEVDDLLTILRSFPSLSGIEFPSVGYNDSSLSRLVSGLPEGMTDFQIPGNTGGPLTFSALAKKVSQFSSLSIGDIVPAANITQAPAWMTGLAVAISNSSKMAYLGQQGNFAGVRNQALFFSAPRTAFIGIQASDGISNTTQLFQILDSYPINGTLSTGFSINGPYIDGYEGRFLSFIQSHAPESQLGLSNICETPTCTSILLNAFQSPYTAGEIGWLTLSGFNTETSAAKDAVVGVLNATSRTKSGVRITDMDMTGREADIGNAIAGTTLVGMYSYSLSGLNLTDTPAFLKPIHENPSTAIRSLVMPGNPFTNPIMGIVQSGVLSTDRIQNIVVDMGSNADLVSGIFWSIFTSQSDPDGTSITLTNAQALTSEALDWVSFLMPFSTLRINFDSETPLVSASSLARFAGAKAYQLGNILARLEGTFELPNKIVEFAKAKVTELS